MRKLHLILVSSLLASALVTSPAQATNGVQLGGNGVMNAAMGGASIATPLDAIAAANNPAGMALLPTMITGDAQIVSGHSTSNYVVVGNLLSNYTTDAAPEFGVNYVINAKMTVGLTLTGEGLGADYQAPALPMPGLAKARGSLRIAEFLPSFTYKPSSRLALGAALDFAHETVNVDGVVEPGPTGPVPLPTHGTQSANGVTASFGALWQPMSNTWLGATYKPRTRMGQLAGYSSDLFSSSDGRLDLPAQWGVGISHRPNGKWLLAADWMHIAWHDVAALGNAQSFNWKNQNVTRLGAAYDVNRAWTVRAGYSANNAQIPSNNVAANLLVPAINSQAWTTGISYRPDAHSSWNIGYELNPRQSITGTGASTGSNLSSRVQIVMMGYERTF